MEKLTVEQLVAKFQDLKDGKINWIQLAILIKGQDTATLEGLRADKSLPRGKVNEVIKAYHVVEALRPEVLSDPDSCKSQSRGVAYIYQYKRRMLGFGVDESEVEKTINEALDGDTTFWPMYNTVEKTKKVVGANLEAAGQEDDSAELNGEQKEVLDSISGAMLALDSALRESIQKVGYGRLEKAIGLECHKLAMMLECVANKEFREDYDDKESFEI